MKYPKHWKKAKLIEVSEKITDGTHQTPRYIEQGIPFISTVNLQTYKQDFDFSKYKKYVSLDDYNELTKSCKPEKGDILISKCGTIGRTQVINVDYEFCIFVGLGIIKLKKDLLDPKYVEYYLNSTEAQREIELSAPGSTRRTLTIHAIGGINISFPDKREQKLIISEIETQFTRLDASIKSLKTVKNKLEVYRKSVLQAAFFGEQKKLSEIVSKEKYALKRGPFGGSLKKEIFVPKGYKVYEQKNAIQNDFSIGKYFVSKEKFDDMQEFKVKPGDFIVSCSGTIGKIAEIPKDAPEGIINQALLKITLDNKVVLNQYFYYLFESDYVQKHLTNISRGVAIKNVPPMKDMKNISFPIPSINEQKIIIQDIESRFSVIDKLEQTIDASLSKAEQLRKSILKSAFEGKLVTTND